MVVFHVGEMRLTCGINIAARGNPVPEPQLFGGLAAGSPGTYDLQGTIAFIRSTDQLANRVLSAALLARDRRVQVAVKFHFVMITGELTGPSL